MAFHLGCLRALQEFKLLEKVNVLSTISGGSVIGAYYAYTPGKAFAEFEADIRGFLRTGFQGRLVYDMLSNPDNLIPSAFGQILANAQDAVAGLTKGRCQLPWLRLRSRTDVFHDVLRKVVFPGLTLQSARRPNLDVVIGGTELRSGLAFRFSNLYSGNWKLGSLADNNMDVAFAVTASAAYPILLPALDRKFTFINDGSETVSRVLLTDGGIYDNLGLEVLEPCRGKKYNLHSLPCEYLIVCNAGRGQDSGEEISRSFFTRMPRSFEVVHRRVQEAAMHHLHHLKETGEIKDFAMPYLGQNDDALKSMPADFVKRQEVVKYPTNFAAMSGEWIDRISKRGEQLTRISITSYLSKLL